MIITAVEVEYQYVRLARPATATPGTLAAGGQSGLGQTAYGGIS